MFYNLSMMKKITLSFIIALLTGCTPESDFEKYKEHVKTLASDEFEGRKPWHPGCEKPKLYYGPLCVIGFKLFWRRILSNAVNLTGINLIWMSPILIFQ